ncbi:glycoside hydrolase family protein [Phyllobacterium sp. CCNWLW109]|uniref:glycoside hydrolase family protein n=1 Tax=Phyllobacterium sp. CCNWLW109 TaxID=3127479 RepID=UPI003FCCC036
MLFRELAIFESFVQNGVKLDMNQNELDVLVSLAFNIGSGTLSNFHIDKKLNARNRVAQPISSLSGARQAGSPQWARHPPSSGTQAVPHAG